MAYATTLRIVCHVPSNIQYKHTLQHSTTCRMVTHGFHRSYDCAFFFTTLLPHQTPPHPHLSSLPPTLLLCSTPLNQPCPTTLEEHSRSLTTLPSPLLKHRYPQPCSASLPCTSLLPPPQISPRGLARPLSITHSLNNEEKVRARISQMHIQCKKYLRNGNQIFFNQKKCCTRSFQKSK